jgi:hypothetical protein
MRTTQNIDEALLENSAKLTGTKEEDRPVARLRRSRLWIGEFGRIGDLGRIGEME